MAQKKKIGRLFWLIITSLAILGLVWSIAAPKKFQEQRAVWQAHLSKLGFWGPIVFAAIQALQVIITPISHYTVGAISGFLYGPFYGTILNYIGRLLGHVCAFFIARRFGRKIVKRFVDEDVVAKYDLYVSGKGEFSPQVLILFLMYFLPLFPDDEISYFVGLSNMSWRSFVWANVFGHICGSLSLASIGSGINTKDLLFWILFVINLAGFPIIWYLMRLVRKISDHHQAK